MNYPRHRNRYRNTLRKYLLALAVFIILGSLPAVADDYQGALAAWSRILERYVDEEGRIDFLALTQDHVDLDAFVRYLHKVSPASRPELFPTLADQLAYHINAYNALAMLGVIEKDIPADFGSFLKRAAFFKFRKVVTGGEKTSLYDYENKVIRPLGEPRVHFALNCMVRDCPRLPRQPFLAEKLESQLQALTLEFFSKGKHIRIDHGKRVVWLSSILDFYTEDFVASGKADDLIEYINGYIVQPVAAEYRVRFLNYDWTVNQQPR